MHKFFFFSFLTVATSHLDKANYEINYCKTEKGLLCFELLQNLKMFVQVRELNFKDIHYNHFGKDVWHFL